jgi:apolipoprotein N-acyltransferase
MANLLIPVEERELTPAQVDVLDRRRRRGQAYLVMGFQTFIVAMIVTLWAGQDATYSPGFAHPMLYWDLLLFAISLFCFARGVALKRGSNEFFSY